LTKGWGWGELATPQVQQLAHYARLDLEAAGARPFQDLTALATLGSSGANVQNMHRDMMNRLPASKLPDAKQVLMPVLSKTSPLGFTNTLMKVWLPHEVFAALFHGYPDAWQKRILPDADCLANFWQAMEGTPRMLDSPLLERADYKSKCIPIRLHGDGVPCVGAGKSWSKSVDIFSWSSLLGTGSTVDFTFLVFAVFQVMLSTAFGHTTMAKFFQVLNWSLLWLYKGVWPDKDHEGRVFPQGSEAARKAGTPLANGYYAILFVIAGDLDHFAKVLKLAHYGALQPCCFCQANNTDMSWTDFRPGTAAWWHRIWTPKAWLDAHPQRIALFKLPGVSVVNAAVDFMHSKYLGVDQYCLGSVLWLLCFRVLQGSPDDNAQRVQDMIHDYNIRNRRPDGWKYVKVTMFHSPGDYPKLKGKAVDIKRLGPALLDVWQQLSDAGDRVHRQVLLALKMGCRLDEIIDEHPMAYKLPDVAAQEFVSCTVALLSLLTVLCKHFLDLRMKLFNVTVKCHYLLHLALDSAHLHPRLGWCFSGEDFMQKLKRIVMASCRGSSPAISSRKVMDKYCFAMHLQLSDLVRLA
jgi:hypothetical protein